MAVDRGLVSLNCCRNTIQAYIKTWNYSGVISVLQCIKENQIAIDRGLALAVLSFCNGSRVVHLDAAEMVMDLLENSGNVADVHLYNALIKLYGRSGELVYCKSWIEAKIDAGYDPQLTDYHYLIRAAAIAEQYDIVQEILEDMEYQGKFMRFTNATFKNANPKDPPKIIAQGKEISRIRKRDFEYTCRIRSIVFRQINMDIGSYERYLDGALGVDAEEDGGQRRLEIATEALISIKNKGMVPTREISSAVCALVGTQKGRDLFTKIFKKDKEQNQQPGRHHRRKGTYRCELCGITCTSARDLEQHYAGAAHKKKERQQQQEKQQQQQ
eukprot:CAMPEP_0167775754 /NCGR_PEP_ID=MMETSP0111_2-20121227/2737_1 /TAXON_ID=91324 /ORGANISM="Lotharella globosa, Strain CCCM811" /LENGTH=327 /DNA_ID=CAMNT_0007665709 /DNA_START=288 /DNA_END=1271 /DNA_ORIENTATION=+